MDVHKQIRRYIFWLLVVSVSFSSSVFAGTSKSYTPIKLKWVTKLKKEKTITRRPFQFSTPVIDKDRIYVGAASGYFYALSLKNGHKVWHTKLAASIYAEPVTDETGVYVADRKGIVYALSKQDGSIMWQVETGAEVSARPLVTEDTVYVATVLKQLVALDKAGHGKKWQTSKTGLMPAMTVKGSSSPVLYNGNIYLGYADGTFSCYSGRDGTLVWSRVLSDGSSRFSDVDSTPVIKDGLIYVSAASGKTFALRPSDGSTIWMIEKGGVNDIATDDFNIYISAGGIISSVDAASGKLAWERDMKEAELSPLALKGETAVVASTKDKIFVVDTKTGEVTYKRFLGKGSFGRPVIFGDHVYILTNSSRLFALSFN